MFVHRNAPFGLSSHLVLGRCSPSKTHGPSFPRFARNLEQRGQIPQDTPGYPRIPRPNAPGYPADTPRRAYERGLQDLAALADQRGARARSIGWEDAIGYSA